MKPSDLKGKRVVLTGTFVTMKRAVAEKILTEAGATISGSISKSTDVLIYGENAGSKLAKATSLGVARMTEAEMVALLVQAGSGADQFAGAPEKLAKAKANAKPESAVASAVSELQAFIETLRMRPDITVTIARVGRRATRSDLALLNRQKGIPEELVELYAAMNGVHVEWRFIEPPGGGCIRVPPLTEWTRFTGDDQTYMGFGDGYDALLLDEIQPEGGTWLVREKESGSAQIIFASAAEGSDGIEPAGSIAAYLRAAIENGFVYYWPRCFRENRHVSYAEQEAAVERFRARPEEPSPIHIGARVHFEFFSEGGRGEVLALHEAAPSRATEFSATEFARSGFEHSLESTFTGLFGGLFLLACHESARRSVAGRDMVDGALRERIPGAAAAASLTAALTQENVLAAPAWHDDKTGEAARELGLPAGAAVLQGSGF